MHDVILRSEYSDTDKEYVISFRDAGNVRFSDEEVWEYRLYEEEREVDLGELCLILLEKRIRQFILPYCAYTRRTEKQIKNRIEGQFTEKNGYGGIWAAFIPEAEEKAVESLRSDGYAGDAEYCRAYIRSNSDKNVSDTKLVSELVKKGVRPDVAKKAAEEAGRDKEAYCRAALEKKLRSSKSAAAGTEAVVISDRKQRESLIRFLISRGFDTDLAIRTVDGYGTGRTDDTEW